MYIYNKDGIMITGPITDKENNLNRIWGSDIYKGNEVTIEVKVPFASKDKLKLIIGNITYRYKEVYGFGQSSACNINILCPLGTGGEQERNSAALILNASSTALFALGALINNTCNINFPYFLTADHCFTGQDVAGWKFVFQRWSATCSPNQDIASNYLFNGATPRANSAATDFALILLNQTPEPSTKITYAEWSRETTGKQSTTIIHHPAGDVMKISRDDNAPNFFTTSNGAQCWQLGLDQGATNGGSSGSPYFDQNHRIIGQHLGQMDLVLMNV